MRDTEPMHDIEVDNHVHERVTPVDSAAKSRVRRFWEENPCGSQDVPVDEGTELFFRALKDWRYRGDEFMHDAVPFDRSCDSTVLEVGCGVGTDLVEFARHGARVVGLDLTLKGAGLARANLAANRQCGTVLVGDAEGLPFDSDSFHIVYSWGVIHHTPDTGQAARELVRVCRPGGRVIVMIYHRYSLVALQAWLVYGLLRGRPLTSPSTLIAQHLESPGTKVFSRKEAVALFPRTTVTRVRTFVTRWDLRVGRRRFLPPWVRRLVPPRLGAFLVVEAVKAPANSSSMI